MRRMKLIPLFLLVGMLAVSGWAEDTKPEPYSPELVKKAEAGDAKAQYDLAVCYCEGEGVEKDYKEGVKWFTKSAEQGDALAQVCLGTRYFLGEGVEKDYKEAVKWFTKSAEQGNQFGQCNLGNCYYECTGVEKDLGEAVKWYTKSAEQGNWTSKEMLERLKSK